MPKLLKSIALACLIVTTEVTSNPTQVQHVVAYDIASRVTADVQGVPELQLFSLHWSQKMELKKDPNQSPFQPFTHKLRIVTPSGATLWLYNPKGYVTVLSKRLIPIYSVQNPATFNALLGIQAK